MAGEEQNFYGILGADREDTPNKIREAYLKKQKDLHPDLLRAKNVSEEIIKLAEEHLKEVNRAYETLRDFTKRKTYDENLLNNRPPIPQVSPPIIRMERVPPGEWKKANFILSNLGGEYKKISIVDPDSWVQVVGRESVSSTKELPLEIFIEVYGEEAGKTYREVIEVYLDNTVAQVQVELVTESATPAVGTNASYGTARHHHNPAPGIPTTSFPTELIMPFVVFAAVFSSFLFTAPLSLLSQIPLTSLLFYNLAVIAGAVIFYVLHCRVSFYKYGNLHKVSTPSMPYTYWTWTTSACVAIHMGVAMARIEPAIFGALFGLAWICILPPVLLKLKPKMP